jgi:hypothetical protein
MELAGYPTNTQIGIVQQVISESTFRELQSTLKGGMKWNHVPDGVKREVVLDTFQYDPLKNTIAIEQAIQDAKATANNIKTEKRE